MNQSIDDIKSQSFSIKLPEYRKAKIELFRLLNLNDLNVLLSCFDIEKDTPSQFKNEQPSLNLKPNSANKQNEYKLFCRLISQQLKMDLNDKKNKIIIDKYFYLVKFALENSFNIEQISCLLTISKKTHDLAIDTSFGNLEETFDYFKNSLLVHAVHRPPFSLQLFSTKELETIFDYMLNSYFKQFKFYKYVFADAIKLNLKFQYTNREDIPDDVLERNSGMNLEDESLVKIDESVLAEKEAQLKKEVQEKNELREFIRNYLGNQLDKMKREITNEYNLGNEQKAVKPVSGNKSPKQTTKSAKKK